MKKYIIILALILFSVPSLFAQFLIRGMVKDNFNKNIPYANLTLINAKDSVIVKASSADENGYFVFEKVKIGSYKLIGTAIGYKKSYARAFELNADIANFSLELTLDEANLKEVQVSLKRPFIEQLIDRTVINVAGSINAAGGNALDVLAKAPGVTVDYQNDAIQLRGKEGVMIMIDGKQSYMSAQDVASLLRGMPSDNIDRIELITNPSAKFDASGNAGIINIRLKKNGASGTNGSLTLSAGSGSLDKERAGIQLNHRAKNLNVFGSYNFGRIGNYWDFELYRNQPDGNRSNIVEQTSFLKNRETSHNAKAGLDYFINSNTTIGVLFTGLWSDRPEWGPASTSFRRAEYAPIHLQTETDKSIKNDTRNQLANLNFQHNFKDKISVFSADLDLGKFNREFENKLISSTPISTEVPAGGIRLLKSEMPTIIDILTAKADYATTFNKKLKLETGLKVSSVRTDNDLQISEGTPTNLIPNPSLNNHFKYEESVFAGYINFVGKLNPKIDFQVGLRAEQTYSEGKSITLNQLTTRNYLKLFPSLFLTRPIGKNQTLAFSYSYRIDRPNYQNLNPSRTYVDPFTYEVGNPNLRPQFTHALELKHSFKSGIYTSFGVNFATDLVQRINYLANGDQLYRVAQNLGKTEGYLLTMNYPLMIRKGWQMQSTVVGNYNLFSFNYQGEKLTAENLSLRFNWNNALTFTKSWSAELGGYVTTPTNNIQGRRSWSGSLDLGLQKAFSSALKLKLSLQDILHTINVSEIINAKDNYQDVHFNFDTRVALLSLSYNFGNQQLKGSRQRKTGSEDEAKRTN